MDEDGNENLIIFSIFVGVALVFGIGIFLYTHFNPYSYEAKYCAGQLCTLDQNGVNDGDYCPPTKRIETGFGSDVVGELVPNSCKAWRR